MLRREFLTTVGVATLASLIRANGENQVTDNTLIMQASTWSELPALLQHYADINGNDVTRVFGYGSLIWSHGELKAGKSARHENVQATVNGAQVDMNIYAAGPNEFRGSDKSTGLYIGMSLTGKAADVTNGLNITVDPEDAKAAIKGFIERELGNPPKGMKVDRLFDADGAEYAKAFAGKEGDALKLYTIQIIKTQENGKAVPALTASANTKSIFCASGISSLDAAHLVLDGHGYARDNATKTGRPGGSALDYFINQVKGFRERNIEHPRIEEIAEQVYRLGAFYSRVRDVVPVGDDGKVDLTALEKLISEVPVEFERAPTPEKAGLKISSLKSRVFLKADSFVDRAAVPQHEKDEQTKIPTTGDAKLTSIKAIFDSGKLDALAPGLVGKDVRLR